MHILPFPVIQKHAAVLIAISQLHALLCKKIQNNAMAQFSQVSGEDEIVFIRARAGVLKESGEGRLRGPWPLPCCWRP